MRDLTKQFKIIIIMLVKFIQDNKQSWEDYLDQCVYAYNTARHESSRYTPFELMFNRRAILPIDLRKDEPSDVLLRCLPERQAGIIILSIIITRFTIIIILADASIDISQRMALLKQAKENIVNAQAKQKRDYDKKHFCPGIFKVGAVVLKKDFTRKKRKGGKLDSKWVGPYKIVRSLGRGLYQIASVSDQKVIARVNGVHLKKYNMPLE